MPTQKLAGLADKLCASIAAAVQRVGEIFAGERPAEPMTAPVLAAPVAERGDNFYFDIF